VVKFSSRVRTSDRLLSKMKRRLEIFLAMTVASFTMGFYLGSITQLARTRQIRSHDKVKMALANNESTGEGEREVKSVVSKAGLKNSPAEKTSAGYQYVGQNKRKFIPIELQGNASPIVSRDDAKVDSDGYILAAEDQGIKNVPVNVAELDENGKSDHHTRLFQERKRQCACENAPDTTYSTSFQLQLPDRSDEDYSSIRVSSIYGMNFATGRNICVRPDHGKTVLLFSEGKVPELEDIRMTRRSGFKYGWNFEIVRAKVPSYRVPGTTIILSPAYTKHVTHFAESSIPIWHALAHPERYPVHSNADRIFLKQSMFKEELEWNRKILIFLAHHLKNASITDVSSFGSGLICFEKAGMVGMGLHEFGFFANEAEAHTFRRSAIRFYQAPVVTLTSLRHKSRLVDLSVSDAASVLSYIPDASFLADA
jgi:hypothetical protein